MRLLQRLNEVGFEKTRRALAALSLSFFITLYLVLSFNAPPGWGGAFLALSACYMVAFLGVAADWFWGRWFASGLGWSGIMVALLSFALLGWSPPLAVYGALHGLIVLVLLGKKMSALYDQQEAWRKRFDMDEYGVARLRKTVTRAAASLPSLILWALGPKDPGQGAAHAAMMIALGVVGVAGVAGVLRMRSWGLLALGASAVGLVVHSVAHHGLPEFQGAMPLLLEVGTGRGMGGLPGLVALLALSSAVAGAALLLAVAPFLRPMVQFLIRRRA